jgi:C_GCAxxG_C_C family probable redox protein
MNREEAVQRSMKYVDDGFLCVEAVLKTLADMKGLQTDYIPAIASGMAAGVARTGQICGEVTGAILGLGLWFGRKEPVASERRPYWYSRLFIERWNENHPNTNCSGLLGIDLDTSEGYAEFSKENMWENKCKRYIREAVGLTYDILVEEGV